MKGFALPLLFVFLLVACAPTQGAAELPTSQPSPILGVAPTPTDDPALIPTLFPNADGNKELARVNELGAVVFEVTPLNLGTPADTLEFDVSMNTHSVELSMDLAPLSSLSTDTGVIVPAVKWDAIPGGHHVSGKLIFPNGQGGKSLLEGVSLLTLTIVNVDAPSRIFEWQLK